MQTRSIETRQGLVIVREATVSDVPQFRELRLDALRDSPTAFPVDYSAYVSHPKSFWEERLQADENRRIFFNKHQGQLIGMTGIRRGESSKTRHSAEIWGVYVRPEWRGLHLGDSLIEACTDWAKSSGVSILNLGVTVASTSALRFYQRCGFTICGTQPRGIYYEGKYYDGYFMFKYLDES